MEKVIKEVNSLCIVIQYGKTETLVDFVNEFHFFNKILILNNNLEHVDVFDSNENVDVVNNEKNLGIFNALKVNAKLIISKAENYSHTFIFNNDLTNINFESINLNKIKGITFFPVIENNYNFTLGGIYNSTMEYPIEKKALVSDFKKVDKSLLNYYYGAAWCVENKYLEQLLSEDFMNNFLYFEELYLNDFCIKYNINYGFYNKLILSHHKSLSTKELSNGEFKQMEMFFNSRKYFLKYRGVSRFKIVYTSLFCAVYFLLKFKMKISYAAIKNI